ncbi:MAG: ubiquitin-like domain-containing protein [Clostridia bacterium]|nr:ubiquitin-like domain-containing protein [Clostridia bacterium]
MVKNDVKHSAFTSAPGRIIAVIFLSLIVVGTIIASAISNYTVNVLVDGQTIKVTTSEQSARIILEQAGVTLGEKDWLDTSEFTVGKSAKRGNQLVIKRAMPVTIDDDGEITEVMIAGTVADALEEAGLTCRPADKMNYKETDLLVEKMTIKITRAFTVDVIADGKKQEAEFLTGTVADVLTSLNITLGENDEVNPSLTTELKAGKTVTVYRVSYEERTATEPIRFETIYKTSAQVYKGETKVEQEGKTGSKEVTYRDKVVDGKVTKSTKLSEKVIEPAQNKILVSGTKIRVLATGSQLSAIPMPYALQDGIPVSVITTITGNSTAYYAAPGKGTASGRLAQSGHVAVDPRQIPYGSELYIVTTDGKYVYGYCIAADTGGFVGNGTIVDLYFNTYDECVQWGNKQVCIYVLKWGNG